jgi:hypothetical protein
LAASRSSCEAIAGWGADCGSGECGSRDCGCGRDASGDFGFGSGPTGAAMLDAAMPETAVHAAAKPTASFKTCRRAIVSTLASLSCYTQLLNERAVERFLRNPSAWLRHGVSFASGLLV